MDLMKWQLALAGMALLLTTPGCTSWRSMHSTASSVAAGRSLARQGISAMECGDCTEGESILREAIDKSPEDPMPRSHLAEALWQRGATEEALEQITEAARLAPGDSTLSVRAGQMLLAGGWPELAEKQAVKSLQLDHQLAAAWALRGKSSEAQGLDDAAMADYQHALLLTPHQPDVLLTLASLYSRLGEQERCLATLHRLIDSYPPGEEPPSVLLLEAKTYLALDRVAEAGERLALATAGEPATAEIRTMQARVEMRLGHPLPAEQFARQALAIDATYQPAREMLTLLSQRAGAVTLPRR